jgi:uncharacterized protein YbjT (DUF2867 family)
MKRTVSAVAALAGSTGYLGPHIVRELKDRGHYVRALARDPARLEPVRNAVDEVFTADATDQKALAGCCDSMDAVISSVGLLGKAGNKTSWDVDYAANRNLLEEAARGRGRQVRLHVRGPRARPREASVGPR